MKNCPQVFIECGRTGILTIEERKESINTIIRHKSQIKDLFMSNTMSKVSIIHNTKICRSVTFSIKTRKNRNLESRTILSVIITTRETKCV